MTGLVAGGALMSAGSSIYGGINSYNSGKAQRDALRAQAAAAKEQADAAAAEESKQAEVADIQAGIAQMQGDREAERRSQTLAQDIGATYANAAGNGIMVDGAGNDTVGALLRSQAGNAAADISTIRDNAAMEVWTHQQSAAAKRRSAAYTRAYGANQAAAINTQANAAMAAGRNSMFGSMIGAGGSLLSGAAGSVKAYKDYGGFFSFTKQN